MYIKWLLLFLICKTIAAKIESDSSNNDDNLRMKISTKHIGRIKYRDGEVVITQNQQKDTDFFFTPFPYLQTSETNCHENVFNDRIELGLSVEFYTPGLIQIVKDYLYKYQSAVCGNTTSSFKCDISLVPMNGIRLVQKGSHSNSTHQKYTLEDNWQPATLRLQSMEFIIYAPNMTVCDQLHRYLTEKCRLSNFELQYSLHGSQTVQKQVEVNTEHVTNTSMYNQIRVQFPSAGKVLLTGSDFEKLIEESTERITMTLRQQEGFESIQDSKAISKQLEQQLSTEQVHLQVANDESWDDLYWTSEWTRPDHLAKILSTIFHKENNDSDNFMYDRQAAKDAIKITLTQDELDSADRKKRSLTLKWMKHRSGRTHLTQGEQQHFGHIETLFSLFSPVKSGDNNVLLRAKGRSGIDRNVLHIEEDDLNTTQTVEESSNRTSTKNVDATTFDEDADTKCTISRKAVEKFLREFFNSVHLVGDIIQPRPINASLIKIERLNIKRKLFAKIVSIQTRLNIQALPLRCKPNGDDGKLKVGLVDRIDQIESTLRNLNNHIEIKNMQDKISLLENNTKKISSDNLDRSLFDQISEVVKSMAWPKHSSALRSTSGSYRRPDQNETTYRYEYFRFTVPTSQYYEIVCFSDMDTYGYLYENSFNSTSPSENLLEWDDDSNRGGQFKFNVYLQTEKEYIVVVTTFHTNVTGTFTIYIDDKINISNDSSFG